MCAANAPAAATLPPEVAATLGASGLPLTSFGLQVQPVDGNSTGALASLNADRPFLLASTTKLVTSLAARWLATRNRRRLTTSR